MAIARQAHTKYAGATNGGTTPPIDTTGKGINLIVLVIAALNGGGTLAVSDSSGGTNVYTKRAEGKGIGGKAWSQIWECLNPGYLNAAHTFTITGAGGNSFAGIYVACYSGVLAASAFDAQNATATTGATSTISTGTTGTVAVTNELIIAGLSEGGTGAIGIDSSFAIVDSTVLNAGTSMAGALAEFLPGTVTAYNPAWTWSGDGGLGGAAAIATWKPALGTDITPTGVAGTGSVGTFAVNYDNAVTQTGVAGTGSAGSFSVVTGQNITPTGVGGVGSAGVFAPTISSNITLSGASGAGSAGTFIVPTTGLTIADFATNRIFQRAAGATTKDIAISGTYTGGAPTALNAVVNIVAGGTALSVACTNVSAAGGTWTATIPAVPQGCWLKATVTEPVSGNSAAQTTQWGVGIHVDSIGQSNQEKMNSVSSGPPASHANTKQYKGSWAAVAGNGNIVLANALRTKLAGTGVAGTDIPIAIKPYAVSGAGLHGTIGSGYWMDLTAGSPWKLYEAGLAAAGGDCEFALWHQGETDAILGTSIAAYKADMDTLYGRIQVATGRNSTTLKFICAMIGSMTDATATDATTDAIRQAHFEWARDTVGASFAGSSIDMIRTDTYHWSAPYYERMGKRYANAIAYKLGITAQASDGPKISSAVWPIASNVITLVVEQRSGGTTLKDGTGSASGTIPNSYFTVTASGGQTVSSIALSAGKILITMSAVRGAGETVSLKYLYGENPEGWTAGGGDVIDGLIYDDNSTLLGDTIGFPLLTTAANGGSITVGTGGGGRRSLSLGMGIQI